MNDHEVDMAYKAKMRAQRKEYRKRHRPKTNGQWPVYTPEQLNYTATGLRPGYYAMYDDTEGYSGNGVWIHLNNRNRHNTAEEAAQWLMDSYRWRNSDGQGGGMAHCYRIMHVAAQPAQVPTIGGWRIMWQGRHPVRTVPSAQRGHDAGPYVGDVAVWPTREEAEAARNRFANWWLVRIESLRVEPNE